MWTCGLPYLKSPAFPLVERGEARAREVGLVAEHAVQFRGVADGFVDGQPQVGRVEHEVVLPGLDRLGGELFAHLLGGVGGVSDHVVARRVARGGAGELALRRRRRGTRSRVRTGR